MIINHLLSDIRKETLCVAACVPHDFIDLLDICPVLTQVLDPPPTFPTADHPLHVTCYLIPRDFFLPHM